MSAAEKKQQVVDEIHRTARRNFQRRRTIIKGLDESQQADLMELQKFSKENKGYRYILVVIDCFSKYTWTRPLKNKTGEEVSKAMASIFTDSKRVPANLHTDMGKEFFNSHFSSLMKTYGINHYSTYSTKKAAIAERVIRTLKSKLYKVFSLQLDWSHT